MKYWEECIAEAMEEVGITATAEQIKTVAEWVEGAHETYGMVHGHDCIPNPLHAENERLVKALAIERSKTVCRKCNGHGFITECLGPSGRSSTSRCGSCHGEGKV